MNYNTPEDIEAAWKDSIIGDEDEIYGADRPQNNFYNNYSKTRDYQKRQMEIKNDQQSLLSKLNINKHIIKTRGLEERYIHLDSVRKTYITFF